MKVLFSTSPIAFPARSSGSGKARLADAAGENEADRPSRGTLFWARQFWSLPAKTLVEVISLYRRTLSPLLPVFLGPGCGCRFVPSCACYAMEAIQTRGAVRGVGLTIVRLLKCTPFHPGGYDPVPPKRGPRGLKCEAIAPNSSNGCGVGPG